MSILSAITSKLKKTKETWESKPVTTIINLTNPLGIVAEVTGGKTKETFTKVTQGIIPIASAITGGIIAGPAGIVGGGAVGSAISGVSYLETAPKTSKAIVKAEEYGYKGTKELVNTVYENPVEASILFGAIPALAFLGAKAGGNVSKGAGGYVGVSSAFGESTDAMEEYYKNQNELLKKEAEKAEKIANNQSNNASELAEKELKLKEKQIEAEQKAFESQLKSQEKLAKMQLDYAKEQAKQVPLNPSPSSSAIVTTANTKKKPTKKKKKSTKKKATKKKKSTKKKTKTYKKKKKSNK